MYCVRMGWGSVGVPDGIFSAQEAAQGIHGGDTETSLMLHFRPDTVDMSKAADFRWTHAPGDIPPIGAIAHGWIASDVNPTGVAGEAHLATAEKGRLTAEHYISGVIEVLGKMAGTDVSGLEAVVDVFGGQRGLGNRLGGRVMGDGEYLTWKVSPSIRGNALAGCRCHCAPMGEGSMFFDVG